ncbi:MAG: hypothetical protein CL927_20360 [Deltaproteobacteria bacterium]|nr:hypothetical protein [Deltaproteobacteria bacterium]HCH63705.1 hypothetical protein [Deltaproteobacteria bacterium]
MTNRVAVIVCMLGLSLWSGLAHAQYRRSDVTAEERAIRRRNAKFLFARAEEVLAADPSDPDGHALRGTAYILQGWPLDAVVEYELAAGGDFYEKFAVHYHGEALRALGRFDEAAALRKEWRVVKQPNQFADIATEIHIVEDFRLAGAWDQGLDAVDVMLATAPGNVLVHAYAAHFFYDMGDVDEAMFQLFLGARQTENNHRYQHVLAAMSYDEGLVDDASDRLKRALRQHPRHPPLRALQLRAWCDGGFTELALTEVGYARFAGHAYPDLLASEARCHVQAGDFEGAHLLVGDLQTLYPELELTEETASFVGVHTTTK